MYAILQEMEWNAHSLETEFIGEAKLFKAEKVLVDILCKVTADKLLTAIIESTLAICTNTFAKSRAL